MVEIEDDDIVLDLVHANRAVVALRAELGADPAPATLGAVLFVMASVGRLKLDRLAIAVMPLLAAELVVLLLVLLFPSLSTAIPAWFGYSR